MSDFAEAIRPELEALPTPEPSPQLFERILASRSASVHVILPEPVAASVPVRKHGLALIAVAAAVLLIVLPVVDRRRAAGDDVVASAGFFSREAFAQPLGRVNRPALAPIVLGRPLAIRPLTLEFSRRVHDSTGRRTRESIDTLAIAPDAVDGADAWRIVSRASDLGSAQSRVETETLYVARADLRMLKRAVHVAPYSRFERINVQQRFHGDSVTGRMTTDGPSIGAGREIARWLRPQFGPYLTDTFAPVALMAAPLSSTWQGSASLLGWAVIPRDVFIPVELRVDGDERVYVPAGTFDCWRLTIRFRGRELRYWVRKSDRLGVRVLEPLDSGSGGTRETVLMRVHE